MHTASLTEESMLCPRRRGRRDVREILAGVVPALVAAATTFLLGCPQSSVPVTETVATADAKAGSGQQNATDPEAALAEASDPASGASAAASANATLPANPLGTAVTADAEVANGDAAASAAAEQTRCYEATQSASLSLFVFTSYRFEIATLDPAAVVASVASTLRLERNDDPPFDIPDANGTATIFGDGTIASQGLPPFSFAGAGGYGAFRQELLRDVISVAPGDRIVLSTSTEVRAILPPGAAFQSSAAGAEVRASLDFALAEVPCGNPECRGNGDCPSGQLCDGNDGTCQAPSFAEGPAPAASTDPAPPVPGQPGTLSLSWNVKRSNLQPLVSEAVIPLSEKAAFNGLSGVNQGIAFCAIGPVHVPVLTTLDPAVLYVDVDGDLVHEPAGDVTITVTEDDALLRIRVDTPAGGDGSTTASFVPFDATITCQGFFGMFDVAKLGPGIIRIDTTSVDPDSGDADDGVGLAPLHATLTLGIPGQPGAVCGDGTLDPGEECDDGNTADDDGCSATCLVEEGQEENCANGADDDGDGAIDLRDADCETGVLTITRASLSRGKVAPGDEKIVLVGSFPTAAVDPPADGVTLTIVRPGTGAQEPDVPIARVAVPPASIGWKTSKQGRMAFKDVKGGSLGDPTSKDKLVIKPNAKKQRVDVAVTITEAEVGPLAAGELSAQLAIGGLGWQVTRPWVLNKKGTVLKAN